MDATTKKRSHPHREGDDDEAQSQSSLVFITRIATIGLFFFGLVAALNFTRPVMVPVIAAFVVGMTIGRPLDRLRQAGVPAWLAALILVASALIILLGGALLLATPVSQWISRAPGATELIRQKLQVLARPLGALQEISAAFSNLGGQTSMLVDVRGGSIVQGVLTFLTPALSEFILFFGTLLFFLLSRSRMKGKLVLSIVDRANRLVVLRIISEVENDLTTYLTTATMINVGVGLCTTAIVWALGVPNAPLWGCLAWFLNYLPYIGPALTTGILFVAAMVSLPTLAQGLAPPLCFVALTTVEGQFLSPAFVGRRLEMNPLAVFLSIAFWTWFWGPVGAFLAVPILIIGMVVWRNISPPEVIDLP